ncbi:MAG: glycosyltransferase family 39 protein [Tolypothrix sp. Co-bin9]|nr:glycosyltransferase family 39 protein [Tolypothrix sp. Co-bin9]
MKSKFVRNWDFNPTWLRVLIIVLLLLGIFFRFGNLDKKVYWFDEAFTSLRLSGYTEAEVVQQLSQTRVVGVEDLQKYQRINPDKGLKDTINSLALEDIQHPPLYYLIARFWMQLFGNSITASRSLTALISLFAFPCIYWLCLELFNSASVGWVAIALMAISPFQVLYAQEAREYSLWTVTILLSSIVLLKALQFNKNRSLARKVSAWGIYAATVSFGLYTFPFSALVTLGHGVYIWIVGRFRFTNTLGAYLLAVLGGFITFIPWILVLINNSSQFDKTLGWTNLAMSRLLWLRVWLRNISCSFLDFNVDSRTSWGISLVFGILVLLLVALICYAIYFLIRTNSKSTWLFIITLIAVTGLAVVLPDLMIGGRRSTTARYLIPCFLGIQLTVAYLLAKKLSLINLNFRQKKLWKSIAIALFSGGVLSCIAIYPAEGWWHKAMSYSIPQAGRIINQASEPLVVSDAFVADLFSLSYYLDPKVKLQVEPRCYTCYINSHVEDKPNLSNIAEGFSEVFLFKPKPSEAWLQALNQEKNYRVQPVYKGENGVLLWKLTR